MHHPINEIYISYKISNKNSSLPVIKNSEDVAQLLFKHWNKDHIQIYESFKVLLLTNSNRVKGIYELSKGGMTGTLVDLRILFAIVLKSLSVGIVLAHNHPSSKLKPSEADIQLTKKICKAAELFDIKVLDHLIITPEETYYSFADHQLL
jgi:DNA repair protein RadC